MTSSRTADRWLMLLGLVGLIVAAVWWYVSHVSVGGRDLATAFPCYYDISPECRGAVSAQPYPYLPAYFWGSLAALVFGAIGFARMLATLNSIASLWVFFLIGLISTDVIGRAAFNHPLPGVPEIVKFSIIGMFWMMAAYTLRTGGHLRSNLILGMVGPSGRRGILVLNCLVGVGLFALITWLAWREFLKVWEINAFEGEEPVRIPIWPVWAIVTGGSALMMVQFFIDMIRIAIEGPSEVDDAGGAHGTE